MQTSSDDDDEETRFIAAQTLQGTLEAAVARLRGVVEAQKDLLVVSPAILADKLRGAASPLRLGSNTKRALEQFNQSRAEMQTAQLQCNHDTTTYLKQLCQSTNLQEHAEHIKKRALSTLEDIEQQHRNIIGSMQYFNKLDHDKHTVKILMLLSNLNILMEQVGDTISMLDPIDDNRRRPQFHPHNFGLETLHSSHKDTMVIYDTLEELELLFSLKLRLAYEQIVVSIR